MDALSSQANVGGYKAVLVAAEQLGRYFPMLMTAAGTIRPARVIILGGGVAGLQALATAKRLGAVVEVSDIRPAVKEQVESLGRRFIDLPELESGEGEGGYAKAVGEDFLIVDLAAEQGGNCELTRAGETVEAAGVRIIGPINLPATVPLDASRVYSRNVLSLIEHLASEGKLAIDREDEITAGALLTYGGEVSNARVAEALADERKEGSSS